MEKLAPPPGSRGHLRQRRQRWRHHVLARGRGQGVGRHRERPRVHRLVARLAPHRAHPLLGLQRSHGQVLGSLSNQSFNCHFSHLYTGCPSRSRTLVGMTLILLFHCLPDSAWAEER